jgi:hypothetical protein
MTTVMVEKSEDSSVWVPEKHEVADRIFPLIVMEANLSERVHCDPIKVLEAMERVGIPADKTHDLAIQFLDTGQYDTGHDTAVSRGFFQRASVTVNDGPREESVNHVIGIMLRDRDGSLRSAEDMNRSLIHELTHMKQYLENEEFREKGAFYTRPTVKKTIHAAGKLALGLSVTTAAATAYELGRTFLDFYEARRNDLVAAYEALPNHGLPALALGAAAVGLAYGKESIIKMVHQRMHDLDPYEQEARANEAFSKDFPMVALA